MIEIDRSKCKKMLVWDDGCEEKERIVIFDSGYSCVVVAGHSEKEFLSGECYSVTYYKNAKPLPEPKPMTALDAMWWAGTRRVYRDKYCTEMMSVSELSESHDLNEIEWNELIRENGETKLKYEEWKQFNFDECDMGEG